MFDKMRKVFGPIAVSLIIGAIALVFVFSGVFPSMNQITGVGGQAAEINGEGISVQDFKREYQQRIQFYQNMMKGNADPQLLEQLGIKNQVMEELIRRKLLEQEAKRFKISVSDEEVRDQIQKMPYFKKDGVFNAAYYTSLLHANRQNPAQFEEVVRNDLARNHLIDLIRSRTKVSDAEVRNEFIDSQDKRQVDYVVVQRQDAKKSIAVSDAQVNEFLASEAGLNATKQAYEDRKFEYVKKPAKPDPKKAPEFQSFDEVKKSLARDLLRDSKSAEIEKVLHSMTEEMKTALNQKKPMREVAKSKGLTVETTTPFNRDDVAIKGIGNVPELLEDAFSEKSELAKNPGAVQTYSVRGNVLFVQNLKSFKPDLSKFENEKQKTKLAALTRKEDAMMRSWMENLRTTAKVKVNQSLVQPATAEN